MMSQKRRKRGEKEIEEVGRERRERGGISSSPLCAHVHVGEKEVGTANVSFLCVVKTQRRWSNKIYKTELTKIRYNNQVLCKYRVDPQRAGLTLIAELTWSNLHLKGVLKKRK